jgi:hypothetical protein
MSKKGVVIGLVVAGIAVLTFAVIKINKYVMELKQDGNDPDGNDPDDGSCIKYDGVAIKKYAKSCNSPQTNMSIR